MTALIHLDPKQKARLARRATRRGRSFSQEVRTAIDFYLDLNIDQQDELRFLTKAANESAKRSLKRLDETIAYVNKCLKAMAKARERRERHAALAQKSLGSIRA